MGACYFSYRLSQVRMNCLHWNQYRSYDRDMCPCSLMCYSHTQSYSYRALNWSAKTLPEKTINRKTMSICLADPFLWSPIPDVSASNIQNRGQCTIWNMRILAKLRQNKPKSVALRWGKSAEIQISPVRWELNSQLPVRAERLFYAKSHHICVRNCLCLIEQYYPFALKPFLLCCTQSSWTVLITDDNLVFIFSCGAFLQTIHDSYSRFQWSVQSICTRRIRSIV